MPSLRNITVYRGALKTFQVSVLRNQVVLDLSGYTPEFTAKWNSGDSSVLFTLTSPNVTIINSSGGIIQVSIPAASTSALPNSSYSLDYQLQLTEAGGGAYPVLLGKLIIKPSVS